MKIILAHGCSVTSALLEQALRRSGHWVEAIDHGEDANWRLRRERADIAILDDDLPIRRGRDLLHDMRLRGEKRPVLLLLEPNTVLRRTLPANTHVLVKPTTPDSLVSFINDLSHGVRKNPAGDAQLGPLCLSFTGPSLWHNEALVGVPRRELSLLVALVKANGSVLSKSTLLACFNDAKPQSDAVIEVYISRLRRRLREFGIEILTQRGKGYYIPSNANPAKRETQELETT